MSQHQKHPQKFTGDGKTWLILFAVFTVIALFNWTRFFTLDLAEGGSGRYLFYFIMETTGAYSVLVLLPALIWFIEKFQITKENVLSHLPLHLAGSVVFGVSHTLLMLGSRSAIYALAGWGSYDYGLMRYRFPMEFTHQFFTYWTVYAVNAFFRARREREAQKVYFARLQQQLSQARLKALQMQLNPHFLFNTLNMISSTLYENPKAADSMIANLSDLLRLTLDSKGFEEHSLEDELEISDYYLAIMKARFGDNLIIEKNVQEAARAAIVPGFILQPLLENSIKYSFEQADKVCITISAAGENGDLKITLDDDGPGMNRPDQNMLQNGFGLTATMDRLSQLYGDDQEIAFSKSPLGGLRVTLHLPFRRSPVKKEALHE